MTNICDICGKPLERTRKNQKRHKGECHKEHERKRHQAPEYKEWERKYQQTPQRKEWERKWRQTPEYKEYMRKYKQLNSPPNAGSVNLFQILNLKTQLNKT